LTQTLGLRSLSSSDETEVLFVYYTYSQQTRSAVEAMAGVLRDRGCEVHQARIEFTDPRYAERFSRFPFQHVYRDLLAMLHSCVAQPDRSTFRTGECREITVWSALARRPGG
jgi:hypothetical protein